VALGALLAVAGCVRPLQRSFATSYRVYQGPPRVRGEVAVVDVRDDVWISAIDGSKDAGSRMAVAVELLPGSHTLCVVLSQTHKQSLASQAVRVEAVAGHVYEVYGYAFTHVDRWAPGVRDVTPDLGCPELAELADDLDSFLSNSRKESPVAFPWPRECSAGSKPLPGFGEKHTEHFQGKGGKTVTVSYEYNRNRPIITVDGDDGETYHLVLGTPDGHVRRVLGTEVSVARLRGLEAFQPLGSELAYRNLTENRTVVYREIEPGRLDEVRIEKGLLPDDDPWARP
jgi:hypothetical protein